MKPNQMKPDQFFGFAGKRTITREDCERIRAIGIMLEANGDDFGTKLQTIAQNQLEVRQARHGHHLEVKGSARHFDSP